jgi:hypothetical protein
MRVRWFALLTLSVSLLWAESSSAAVSFDRTTLDLPVTVGNDLSVGDLDGKNGPDIVAARKDDGLAVWLNKGNGTFGPSQTYTTGCPVGDVELGDLGASNTNNSPDGKLDAVILCNSQTLGRMAGNGNGGFSSPLIVPALNRGSFAADGPQNLALGELRAPGLPPVPFFTAGLGSPNYTRLLCWTYDWQQSTCVGGGGPNQPESAGPMIAGKIADARIFNAGGDEGLLDWGFSPDVRASTRQSAPRDLDSTSPRFFAIAIGDLEGDGPDLMSSSGTSGVGFQDFNPQGKIAVNYGTDAAGVPNQVARVFNSQPGVLNIATGDFDVDGDEDVIGTSFATNPSTLVATGGIFVQPGDGNGGLGAPQYIPISDSVDRSTAPIRVADFDGNGAPDAVAFVAGQVQVFLNTRDGGGPLDGITSFPKKAKVDSKGKVILGSATNPPTASVQLTVTTTSGGGGGKPRSAVRVAAKKKKVVLGKAKVKVPAGEEKPLKVKLSKKGRKLLAKGRGKVKTTVKIVATGTDGTTDKSTKKLKLSGAKKKK